MYNHLHCQWFHVHIYCKFTGNYPIHVTHLGLADLYLDTTELTPAALITINKWQVLFTRDCSVKKKLHDTCLTAVSTQQSPVLDVECLFGIISNIHNHSIGLPERVALVLVPYRMIPISITICLKLFTCESTSTGCLFGSAV